MKEIVLLIVLFTYLLSIHICQLSRKKRLHKRAGHIGPNLPPYGYHHLSKLSIYVVYFPNVYGKHINLEVPNFWKNTQINPKNLFFVG